MEWVQSPGPRTGAIRTIDDLPRLSDLRPIAAIEVDRLSIQEIAHRTSGFRSGVRLIVKAGNQPHTELSIALKYLHRLQQRFSSSDWRGKSRPVSSAASSGPKNVHASGWN